MTVAVMPALDAHTHIPAPSQLDVAWNSIFQTDNAKPPAMAPKASSMAMSNQSRLDLCTESLGCETGSHDVMECLYARTVPEAEQPWEEPTQEEEEEEEEMGDQGVLTAVRYHRAPRAFPPPLPSMSRRLQMRPVRRNGRLMVEAVAAKPQGYLHARRQEGRLKLCFVDCCSVSDQNQSQSQKQSISPMQQQIMVPQEEEEDDDEVEVVDRGTMVEVVAASGGKASRIVINKFVGGAPMSSDSDVQQPSPPVAAAAAAADHPHVLPGMRQVPSSTTTLAAAVAAAASSSMDDSDDDDDEADSECETSKEKKKLVFSWRAGAGAGDREELVQRVRRCRQLRRHKQPLFILESYYTINIAT